MAPKSSRARAGPGTKPRGREHNRGGSHDGVANVYSEMLSDAGASNTATSRDGRRPLKRRRVAGTASTPTAQQETQNDEDDDDDDGVKDEQEPMARLQTITDDSESSESEFEWEDVGIDGNDAPPVFDTPPKEPDEPLEIVIGGQTATQERRAARRRRPVTSAEKSRRIDIHRMHILYLLYHCFYRNSWCNDQKSQAILKRLVNPRIINMLNPDPAAAQAQRARLFIEGLTQVCDLFYLKFKVLARGLQRPRWIAEHDDIGKFKLPDNTEKPMELADFRGAAQSLEGSADLGAQLFCTLLRAIGVEARLVCSLQPLGFASVGELPTPQKTSSQKTTLYVVSPEDDTGSGPETTVPDKTTPASPTPLRRIARMGQARVSQAPKTDLGRPPPALTSKPKRVQRPAHPVFWIEAFNSAHQKWVPVDAIATKTVGKASRLEPGFNDPQNCMSYVIAFEEDGIAKDVTRRYAKQYNAKTRKLRVESTDGGRRWLRRAMKIFKRYRLLDRDQVEDSELAIKEASEGMPRNVQDFKDHPYYILERHLKKNEILHLKQETGRINVGSAASARFEPVYRRRDVHIVRSADKWFRLGREVKTGEQPLKHARPRRVRGRESSVDPDAEEVGTGLYAAFQTELYIPPPVVNGRIPKNAYGNLDIYVPSMIPAGAVHIRSPEAKNAAKLLNLDFADAVTGFQFKGRHGTAVTEGIIVAAEFRDAVGAVLDGFAYARKEALEARRSAEALRLWRRFLIGLRIMERVKGYRHGDEGEDAEAEDRDAEEELQREIEKEIGQYENISPELEGGGFFIDQDDNGDVVIPTVRHFREDSEEGGGFLPDQDAEPVPPQPNSLFGLESFGVPKQNSEIEMDDFGGGGFLIENEPEQSTRRGPEEPPPRPTNDDSMDLQPIPTGAAPSAEEEQPISLSIGHSDNGKDPHPPQPIDTVMEDARNDHKEAAAPPIAPVPKTLSPEPEKSNSSAPETIEEKLKPSPSSPGDDTMSPAQADAAQRSSEELEDDDLPLEDPEDEDAEPEWLL